MFAFFNPHELLQNKNQETCWNAFKSIYEDEIDFSKLVVEIGRFNDSYETAVQLSNAVLLRLTFYDG